MTSEKGFTLVELIVAVIILGILTAIAIPNFNTYITQGAAQAANNNLITIYGAQHNHFLNNGSYCTTNCTNLSQINSSLSLNIVDNYFSYTCNFSPGAYCEATYNPDNTFILLVNLTGQLVSK